MKAHAARKKSVAVGNVDFAFFVSTRRNKLARTYIIPHIKVISCVANDYLFTRRARRCVQSDDLVKRYGKHSVRISVSQVLFAGKRQFCYIVKRLYVGGLYPRRVHAVAVKFDVVINSADLFYKSFGLQFLYFFMRHCLDFFLPILHSAPQFSAS